MVVMVYAKTAYEGYIKIGSWDSEAMSNNQAPVMLKTLNM